ncbi:MAG: hypothetical protein V1754_15410 [Pseudomonadota bacterium]
MLKRKKHQTILVAFILVTGCGGRNVDVGTDAGSGDANQPMISDWEFEPDDKGEGSPAITLKLEKIEGTQAQLGIEGRGLPRLQGLAFRLVFGPNGKSEVIETKPGINWLTGGTKFVSKFSLRPEGELWGGIGHEGSYGMDATTPTVLATVTLKLNSSKPVEISFRPKHNLVLDPDGKQIEVLWLGGRFVPKMP